MKDLLFDIESLNQKERLTYVVRGTPGIGKTTMLFYLLWECMREESPFTAVLFATNNDVFVARKTSAGWTFLPFKRGSRVSSFGGGFGDGRAIGLVDVNPEGEIKEQGTVIMGFNAQAPCSEFGLHRLVVVSSAGAQLSQLISKTGDKFRLGSSKVILMLYNSGTTSKPMLVLRCPGWSSFFSTTSSKPLWNNLWTGLLARTSLVRIARRKMPTPWCF